MPLACVHLCGHSRAGDRRPAWAGVGRAARLTAAGWYQNSHVATCYQRRRLASQRSHVHAYSSPLFKHLPRNPVAAHRSALHYWSVRASPLASLCPPPPTPESAHWDAIFHQCALAHASREARRSHKTCAGVHAPVRATSCVPFSCKEVCVYCSNHLLHRRLEQPPKTHLQLRNRSCHPCSLQSW